ncbi:hypothetical protein RCH17_001216 [Arthrobacter sp. MP_M7]|nr:hypothetical protein [Arthrobacter sp. MP_M4]MEC5202420.1 hypothetical protein [Arthrobacter sp. MP_M7]
MDARTPAVSHARLGAEHAHRLTRARSKVQASRNGE